MSNAVHERRSNPDRRIARRRNGDRSRSFPAPPNQDGTTILAMDRLWTVHQASAFLGRSTSWVYKAAESGVLPRARGMAWGLRFLPADLMAYARGDLPGRRRERT
jgi:hypothetical protein